MRVLVIDNYDSFVYNLVQYAGARGAEVIVRRNEADLSELEEIDADRIIISPGPGRPEEAGVSAAVVRALGATTPLLGVCLGHQVIGAVFGAHIGYARSIMHGKVSLIYHDSQGIYSGLKNPIHATRYHSLAVSEVALPACLLISARAADGEIMGLRHRTYPIEGVQFHPESILTEAGRQLVDNFLQV
ncbi:MAG TPA: aminodeoxychorismate/anthranilate synthase component II [Methanomicrobia archaeon]|nr:aminodeoxychorismate/anthranilate synthase component II [Methanomicrobia archaeon]